MYRTSIFNTLRNRVSRRYPAIALLAVLLLGACSNASRSPESQQLRPLAPLFPGEVRQLSQHLQVHYRGEQKDLIAASLIAPEAVRISLLSPQGVSLMDIQYDGRALNVQQATPAARALPAEALLADLQLVYWPLDLLQQSLPQDWELKELKERNQPAGLQRHLMYRGHLHTQVDYSGADIWTADVQLSNLRVKYSLRIKNLL